MKDWFVLIAIVALYLMLRDERRIHDREIKNLWAMITKTRKRGWALYQQMLKISKAFGRKWKELKLNEK